ncbi:MAG: RsmE family RNA methyltransferase [Planctomycetota bacterium]
MNLLLLRQDEVGADDCATLSDRRARHLREVLGVAEGRMLRAGLLDGALGHAEVLAIRGEEVRLRCRFDEPAPPRSADLLLLAVPRPKVLGRCIEHATALGFGSIVLVRSWFTDKSHLSSTALSEADLETRVLAGLEQARRTMRPEIRVEALFRPFVEDRLDALCGDARCYLADPRAPRDLLEVPPVAGKPIALAIGPERGFNDFECRLLEAHRFAPVHAGPHPLRVETAVTALFAQLDVLRRMKARG